MRTIQISVADSDFAANLSRKLEQSGVEEVVCVDVPDVERGGVLVMDLNALDCVRLPLANPDRVVLVTPDDGCDFDRAFEAGIKSVVSGRDALDTVLLAIMAADLQVTRSAAAARWGGATDSSNCDRTALAQTLHKTS
jgi:hypothetical protein